MQVKCSECEAMAAEMQAALAELSKRPGSPRLPREEIQATLARLFSSEREISRLEDSFRNSKAGETYVKWTEHRIATGHTGTGAFN
jgi:hypothetical protein